MPFFQRLYFYYFKAVSGVIYLLLYPAFYIYLKKPENYHKANALRGTGARVAMLLCRIRPRNIIKARLDTKRTYIVCANHRSELDIIHLIAKLPLFIGFMAKSELTESRLMRIFFDTIDIPVDRSRGEQSAAAYRRAVRALQSGQSVVIFAEGGIIPGPENVKPFKDGAFQMAIRHGYPILPITLPDNDKVLPDGGNIGKPGKIRLILHEVVETTGLKAEDVEDLKNKVYQTIAGEFEHENR